MTLFCCVPSLNIVFLLLLQLNSTLVTAVTKNNADGSNMTSNSQSASPPPLGTIDINGHGNSNGAIAPGHSHRAPGLDEVMEPNEHDQAGPSNSNGEHHHHQTATDEATANNLMKKIEEKRQKAIELLREIYGIENMLAKKIQDYHAVAKEINQFVTAAAAAATIQQTHNHHQQQQQNQQLNVGGDEPPSLTERIPATDEQQQVLRAISADFFRSLNEQEKQQNLLLTKKQQPQKSVQQQESTRPSSSSNNTNDGDAKGKAIIDEKLINNGKGEMRKQETNGVDKGKKKVGTFGNIPKVPTKPRGSGNSAMENPLKNSTKSTQGQPQPQRQQQPSPQGNGQKQEQQKHQTWSNEEMIRQLRPRSYLLMLLQGLQTSEMNKFFKLLPYVKHFRSNASTIVGTQNEGRQEETYGETVVNSNGKRQRMAPAAGQVDEPFQLEVQIVRTDILQEKFSSYSVEIFVAKTGEWLPKKFTTGDGKVVFSVPNHIAEGEELMMRVTGFEKHIKGSVGNNNKIKHFNFTRNKSHLIFTFVDDNRQLLDDVEITYLEDQSAEYKYYESHKPHYYHDIAGTSSSAPMFHGFDNMMDHHHHLTPMENHYGTGLVGDYDPSDEFLIDPILEDPSSSSDPMSDLSDHQLNLNIKHTQQFDDLNAEDFV